MYNHILIPTDGSELAQRGVDQGLSLAKLLGSRASAVIATERFPTQEASMTSSWIGSPADYERYEEEQKRFANDVLSAIRAEAGKLGVAINTLHVPNAHPATAIIETAANLECDLIVMASHGRRGIRRLLLGSQTAEVLASSHTAVLVVR